MAKSAAKPSTNKKAGAKDEKPKAAVAKAKKAEVKKIAPKKAEVKKAAPVKAAAKKEVAKKVATKKETAKPTAKAAKPVLKTTKSAAKAAAKPAPKKAAPAKPVAKKEAAKPAPKAVKAAPKKIEKAAAKTPEKASPKKADKVIKHATTERIEEMSPMSKKERVPLAPGRSHKVTVENESLTMASPTQQHVPDAISDSTASQLQHLDAPTVSDPKQPDPVRHDRETPSYGDTDLKEFQKIIDSAKEEAMDELRMLRERLDDLNNSDFAEESGVYSMHMAEQGNEAQEKEKTYAQIQRINDYARKLDEATARIQDKTYGVCRECNILIAKQRLMAVPITTLSASWKIRQQCPPDGVDRVGKQQ